MTTVIIRNARRMPINFRLIYVITLLLFSGCASIRHALPVGMSAVATVDGMDDVRATSGYPSAFMVKDFTGLIATEETKNPFIFKADKTYSFLAISGGGGNGAYGAGILNGWSKAGDRPEFKVVTGISTGAIIAPFAFLGSEYDDKLKDFYTKYSTKDLLRKKSFFSALFSDSLTSNAPLEQLIDKNFDAALLKRIAEEYEKGRRLYVGTTNLDEQKLIIWDMGKIASRRDEESLRLFRKIILASSAIPVAFPPVYFDVQAGNKKYDEMHVDGGITKQVFFLYDVVSGLDTAIREKGIDASKIKYKIYVIRNGYAEAVWKEIPDRLLAISERAMDTMTNAQGVGDLYQLYMFTKEGKGDFNLAYIPSTHVPSNKELFDRKEMQSLFDLGFEQAAQGYPWRKTPPGTEKQ